MICAHSFIKDLEEIIQEAHTSSNEFQSEICQAKCQIWNFVHQQIQNLKCRKKLDFAHSTPKNSTSNFSICGQMDTFTEPVPELNCLSEKISCESSSSESCSENSKKDFEKHVDRGDGAFERRLVTRSVETPAHLEVSKPNSQENKATFSLPGIFHWFQFSTRMKKFFVTIVIGFLIWVALVYGLLLGVSVCANGSCFSAPTRRSAVF